MITAKITKIRSSLQKALKKIYIFKNRSTLIITIMILGTLVAIVPLVLDDIDKKKNTPLGANDQNAIMAIPQPPQKIQFLVLSSERRQCDSQGFDKYMIFPHVPVESTSFYFKERSGKVLFETGVFCVDWEKADEKIRKAVVSIQRNGNINIKKAFDINCDSFKKEDNIDGLQVYSMNYPATGEIFLTSYGNCLILARDREALVRSMLAIKYSTTRLSWNENSCQATRTFIDSSKRYHFFLRTSEPGKIKELPHKYTQSLPVDSLKNMAISRVDPYGATHSVYTWLTRRDRRNNDEKADTCASTVGDNNSSNS